MIYLSYIISVLAYAVLAGGAAWVLAWWMPILTPFGGLMVAGIIFFGALLMHEIAWYRRQQRRLAKQAPSWAEAYVGAIHRVSQIHAQLMQQLSQLGLRVDKQVFIDDLSMVEAELSNLEIPFTSQRFFTILERQLGALEKLAQALPQASMAAVEPRLQVVGQRHAQTVAASPEGTAVLRPATEPEPRLSLVTPAAPLPEDQAMVLTKTITDMLAAGSFQVHTAVVSRLPAKVAGFVRYEAIVPGAFPESAWHDAKVSNLMPYLDNALLVQILQSLRERARREPQVRFIIAVHVASLQHADFIDNIIEFAKSYPELGNRLVFEVADWDLSASATGLEEAVKQLSQVGIGLALRQTRVSSTMPTLPSFPIQLWVVPGGTTQRLFANDPTGAHFVALQQYLSRYGCALIVFGAATPEWQRILVGDASVSYLG